MNEPRPTLQPWIEPVSEMTLRKQKALGLLFYVLISLLMVGPHISPPTKINGINYAPEDSYIILWDFWWTNKAVAELRNPYWTDFVFHPSGSSLAFHVFPMTYGLLSVPFQYLIEGTNGRVIALNFVILLSFIMSGFGAYLLAIRATGKPAVSLISGLLFAFMPFHFLNMVSLHLLAIEFLPFYILSLLRLSDAPRTRGALWLGLSLALVFYSSLEYAAYLIILTVLWLGYRFIGRNKVLHKKFLGNLALGGLFFTLVASPLLYQQGNLYWRDWGSIDRDMNDSVFWSPALLSFVTPSRVHPVYGSFFGEMDELAEATGSPVGMRSETSIGFVTLGLALLAMIAFRRDERVFWGLGAICFLVLTLGPYLRVTGHWLSGVPMPYNLFSRLPLLSAGRDPTRFYPIAMLCLSILAAYGLDYLVSRLPQRLVRALIIVLLIELAAFENQTKLGDPFEPVVHPVYRQIEKLPGDFAVLDLTAEPMNLFSQTLHGKRIGHIDKAIPRTPSRNWMLSIEHDFRFPERVKDLGSGGLPERLRLHKKVLDSHHIKYVILPHGSKIKMQIELALLLGARVQEIEGVYLGEFF